MLCYVVLCMYGCMYVCMYVSVCVGAINDKVHRGLRAYKPLNCDAHPKWHCFEVLTLDKPTGE